jgi:Fe2+ transport system protein FeoA/rubredoxin
MKCALCGYEFSEHEGQTDCQGCPLAGLCSMVRCPNCGYDNPRGSKLGGVIHRLWHRVQRGSVRDRPQREIRVAAGPRSAPAVSVPTPTVRRALRQAPSRVYRGAQDDVNAVSLHALSPGQAGLVAGLTTVDPGRTQRLLAMGVVPGSSIKLLRSFPAYVFEVGFTQVAVDESIAREILVRVDD